MTLNSPLFHANVFYLALFNQNTNIMGVIQDFLFHCEFEKRLSSKTLKAYSIDLKQFESYMLTHYTRHDVAGVEKEELKQYVQSLLLAQAFACACLLFFIS